MLGCPLLGGYGQQGGPGPGRLQICERTDLLVVEINTVSCCSHSGAMEAGRWPARGHGTPWIYRSISGEYACLEKRFVTDLGPARPGPRVRQDLPWIEATPPAPPPSGCPSRGPRRLGKEAEGDRAAPRERTPRRGSTPPAARQGPGPAAAGAPGRRRLEGGAEGPLPAAPPSYETHMLRRLRAGQGGRKPNEPRPPPYVAPPAYDAPHRTLPAKRPRAAPQPPAAKRGRAAPPRKGAPGPPDSAGRRRSPEPAAGPAGPRQPRFSKEVLGGWSYHAGSGSLGRRAGTGPEGGTRGPARGGSAESLLCRAPNPDGGSHTLPRAAGGAGWARPAAGPRSAPGRQRLPSGWGFGYAPSPAASAGSGLRPGRRAPPSPRPTRLAAGPAPKGEGRGRPGVGGVFVIDATGAVIRAEYIPAPRRGQARLPEAPRSPDPPSRPLSPPHGGGSSAGQVARISGLPAAQLGLAEPRRAGPQPDTARPWGQRAGAAAQGRQEPLAGGPGPPGRAASPQELPQPPGHGAHPPAQPSCAQAGWEADEGGEPRARPCAKCPALCAHDLREAVSRIRRHTAPDSDSDSEPEEEPVPRGHMAWRARQRCEALSYSSSSSLESSGSGDTVVPGEGGPGPEAGGLERVGAGTAA
ncbi:dendrin [Emydura macquarii macquarii]|uniref:dendrin n=1 Tax=Emydura macquarii macquarii TaxID=1129001 RepID=UPI00352BC659